ncbi:MAG: Ig-like domain-containing protein [Tannerella sp.]|jgi:hypothetical protein|nr:Ig-like domain-containing protein [Tannerella sp.]
MSKNFFILCIFVAGMLLQSCDEEKDVALTGFLISSKSVTLPIGDSYRICVTPVPHAANNITLNWTSSNESVATVKDGLVTAAGIGTAVVTVSSENISLSVDVKGIASGSGGVLESAAGYWEFEDLNDLSKATKGIPLELFGHITPVDGPSSANKAVRIELGSDNYLKVFHGETSLANWTIMVVFKMLEVDGSKWHTILQTDITPAGDADFFVRNTALIGVGAVGYVGPALEAGKWYRLVMSRRSNMFSSYVNGVQYHNKVDGSHDRFNLKEAFLISQDEDNEDHDIDVAEIAVWDKELSANQVKKLGGALD